jgi:hypothetical protein
MIRVLPATKYYDLVINSVVYGNFPVLSIWGIETLVVLLLDRTSWEKNLWMRL